MRKSPLTIFAVAGVALILVLIPFHAFITVWGNDLLGHYTLLRLWKELLLLPLLLVTIWLVLSKSVLRQYVLDSWLFRLIVTYVLFLVILGLIALKRHMVNRSALSEGLIVDLRLVAFFFVAWAGASYSPWLKAHWRQLLLIPAAIVILFGLLQVSVLPANFLSHFGYNASTIQPFETVDQNMQFVRAQSTLRGANPLGAYLVIVIAAIAVVAAGMFMKLRSNNSVRRPLLAWSVFGLVALVVLYFTYARSAYVGALLAGIGAVWLSLPRTRVKRWLIVGVTVVCVLFGGVAVIFRHNTTFEDTFFHTSQVSKSSQSSNHNHTTALKSGIHDVLHEPFGRGPGTAGPASVHNLQPARVSENFYLQIGQEAGWLGLGLFIAINVMIGKILWDRRVEKDQLAMVLLVSLAGLSFVNLLLHAWADDTLAYLWWGLAGIATASVVTEKKAVRDKKG